MPGHLVIDDAEVELVRMLYGWLVDEQITIRQILKRLNHGPHYPRRHLWSPTVVHHILADPVYAGIAYANRTVMTARPTACPSRNVKAEEIETAMWDHVAGLLSNPERLVAQFEHLAATAEAGTTRDRAADQQLRARLHRIIRADTRLLDAYEADAINLAPTADAALLALDAFEAGPWGRKYVAIAPLWRRQGIR